jgi:UDP-N-acetylglucosamine 2-epimerase
MGYLAMIGLMRGARIVMTDSGGMQEETTGLGVPCLTFAPRPNAQSPLLKAPILWSASARMTSSRQQAKF